MKLKKTSLPLEILPLSVTIKIYKLAYLRDFIIYKTLCGTTTF